ncbi:MAG: hypothetical protein D6698_10340 [Gammaproteobacteria bacterium]|nr:MAG: hypothetical protein D6698_10340 [Gammaproteobacteria bacterium]
MNKKNNSFAVDLLSTVLKGSALSLFRRLLIPVSRVVDAWKNAASAASDLSGLSTLCCFLQRGSQPAGIAHRAKKTPTSQRFVPVLAPVPARSPHVVVCTQNFAEYWRVRLRMP